MTATLLRSTPERSVVGLPPCDAEEPKRRLASRDEYRVEVPIIRWGERQFAPWRVSIQGYDPIEDVEMEPGR